MEPRDIITPEELRMLLSDDKENNELKLDSQDHDQEQQQDQAEYSQIENLQAPDGETHVESTESIVQNETTETNEVVSDASDSIEDAFSDIPELELEESEVLELTDPNELQSENQAQIELVPESEIDSQSVLDHEDELNANTTSSLASNEESNHPTPADENAFLPRSMRSRKKRSLLQRLFPK